MDSKSTLVDWIESVPTGLVSAMGDEMAYTEGTRRREEDEGFESGLAMNECGMPPSVPFGPVVGGVPPL